MMKTILNTLIVTTLLASTSVFAETAKPYAVFNPLTMFENSVHQQVHRANSAFYNYGNSGYDFVVEAAPMPVAKLPHQFAGLNQ